MTDFDPTHKFYVGQEVACINNGQPKDTTLPSELVVGQTYRIRWLGVHKHYLEGTYLGIRVEGVDRGICQIWGDVDTPFRATRFRPLVSDPIAVFRNMVADPNGYKPPAPEGPVHPDGPLPEIVREKEEV